MTDKGLYIGITEPEVARRECLLASKAILDALKRYDAFRLLREDKMRIVFRLKNSVDELVVLNRKLRSHLPRHSIKFAVKEQRKTLVKPSKGKTAVEEPVHEDDALAILESHLKGIEEKLGRLEA